jgi:hypothetical protein
VQTVVKEFMVDVEDTDKTIPIQLANEAGGLKLEIRSTTGNPIEGASVEWYWDEDHLTKSTFDLPYLQETTGTDGVVLMRGFPADHPELVFRVTAAGFKSTVLRCQSGTTVSSPRLELIWLEAGG